VFNSLVMMTEYTVCTSMPIAFYKVVLGENYSSRKIPYKNLSVQIFIQKKYQLAPLAKLRLYTWSPRNIYHSLVDSNEIHRSFASIGLKSNSTTKYSIIQASTQLDLS
jgi:hypothetical protein